jgi:hypothetical protein
MLGDRLRGVFRKQFAAGDPCPATDFPVDQQSQTAEVFRASRKLQAAEYVLEV